MKGWFDRHKSIKALQPVNKTKEKKCMIISIDAEKMFDKVQHPFIMKTLNKIGGEESYLHTIKAIYEKPMGNFIISGGKN